MSEKKFEPLTPQVSVIAQSSEDMQQVDVNTSLNASYSRDSSNFEPSSSASWKNDPDCYVCERPFSTMLSQHHWLLHQQKVLELCMRWMF